MSPPRRPAASTRRAIVLGALAGSACASLSRVAHAALTPTPPQSEGPFYPVDLPLDVDADLVRVSGRADRALGTIAHVHGRVTDPEGVALDGARIEIWQCDAIGRYLHPGDRGARARDAGFQGFGRTVADADGRYRFRTIEPVPYPGRAPHIHFSIEHRGTGRLVTQMYVAGAPGNDRDPLLGRVRAPASRRALIVELVPLPGRPGELTGRFDIVLDA